MANIRRVGDLELELSLFPIEQQIVQINDSRPLAKGTNATSQAKG